MSDRLDGGTSLGVFVAKRQRLTLEEAAEIVLQVAECVATARRKGGVHGPLDVSNLFLTRRPDGSPVAKVHFGATPERAPPSENVDTRYDVWVLGVIFYELLTGETPFTGPAHSHGSPTSLEGAVIPIRSRLPELPLEIAATIGRCLLRDPAARFPSVAELAAEVAPFAPKRPCRKPLAPLLVAIVGVFVAALLGIAGSVVAATGTRHVSLPVVSSAASSWAPAPETRPATPTIESPRPVQEKPLGAEGEATDHRR